MVEGRPGDPAAPVEELEHLEHLDLVDVPGLDDDALEALADAPAPVQALQALRSRSRPGAEVWRLGGPIDAP